MSEIIIKVNSKISEEVNGKWFGTETGVEKSIQDPTQLLENLRTLQILCDEQNNIFHQAKFDPQLAHINQQNNNEKPPPQQHTQNFHPANQVLSSQQLKRNGCAIALLGINFESDYNLRTIKSDVKQATGFDIKWDGDGKYFPGQQYWFIWVDKVNGQDQPLPDVLQQYAS